MVDNFRIRRRADGTYWIQRDHADDETPPDPAQTGLTAPQAFNALRDAIIAMPGQFLGVDVKARSSG